MTTLASPITPSHPEGRPHPQRSIRRSRAGTRAFALGAVLAMVCAALAWAIAGGLHHSRPAPAPRPAATTHAAATESASAPATTVTSAATGSGAGTGSGSASGTGTHAGPSADTLALQRNLGQLNYYEGPVDGVSGAATITAIKDFQRANGLTADGIAGPATMAKINQQLVTGDNQMGPSGPPVKPAGTTPAHSSAGHATPANAQSETSTGGAAVAPTPAPGA